MKKFRIIIEVTTDDEVQIEDICLEEHSVIDGYELTRDSQGDLSTIFRFKSADIVDKQEINI